MPHVISRRSSTAQNREIEPRPCGDDRAVGSDELTFRRRSPRPRRIARTCYGRDRPGALPPPVDPLGLGALASRRPATNAPSAHDGSVSPSLDHVLLPMNAIHVLRFAPGAAPRHRSASRRAGHASDDAQRRLEILHERAGGLTPPATGPRVWPGRWVLAATGHAHRWAQRKNTFSARVADRAADSLPSSSGDRRAATATAPRRSSAGRAPVVPVSWWCRTRAVRLKIGAQLGTLGFPRIPAPSPAGGRPCSHRRVDMSLSGDSSRWCAGPRRRTPP